MCCNEVWKSKYYSEKISNKDICDSFFKFLNYLYNK